VTGPSPWLDVDDLATWRSWLRLSTELPGALNRQLQATSDLTLQDYDVLVQLAEVPGGRLRISVLAQAVHWERSRLSHHVKRMEARGLVVREACDDDGRGNFVALTPAGSAALDQASPGHARAVRNLFFAGLAADEKRQLRMLTEKMLTRVREAGTGPFGDGASDDAAGPPPAPRTVPTPHAPGGRS
jgi:DNA-binding MarR family transcriptional regulator